ncbi:cobalamin binding intrinsic factor-like [Poecile atricapillus]|uniref:cobalamin binding intrinsic factor-like n=1 Tax=Poecile atricapillus TaxID=48891 RepID=UPI002738F717|nr:cobalamin binding intrinsic factor-like [Poecile atricapillus]
MAYSIGVLLALASAMVTQGWGECQSSCSGIADRPVTLQGDKWVTHRAPADLPSVAEGCQATVTHHHLVQKLLQRMEESVKFDEPPNPSILLAMNLAGATHGHIHRRLLREIKKNAVERAQTDMTSGQVALHVLALLSSCQNPWRVHAMGKTIDLIRVLQQKTDEEMAKLEAEGIPKTTLYSVGLDALALCLADAGGAQGPSVALAKQVLSPESHLFVDTRAMVALALACVYNYVELQDVRDLLQEALWTVSNSFLDEQEKGNGMIGNIYSMGLALQVLEATRKFYAPRKWDCAQAFSVVFAHDYQQPMAIAQVLPALVGKSYLDVNGLDCAATQDMSTSQQLSLSPMLGTHGIPRAPIQVTYSITNELQGKPFHYSTTVTVPSGSTLLKVMKVAEEENPQIFSFQTEQTSWGPYVTSIHGLAGSTDNRTYWQFLSAGVPLDEGVGTYKPHDGEHIQAVFSTY